MPTVYVKTPWTLADGAYRMAVADAYPATWTDITGQGADVVPPTVNLMLAMGDVSAGQKTALEADGNYAVSTSLDTAFQATARAYTDDLYCAPDGTAEALGTAAAPITLAEGLTRVKSGNTLLLLGGVYTWAADAGTPFAVPASTTLRAAAGEIPVLTHTDGGIPRLHCNAGATVRGVWFGGTKGEDRAVTVNAGVTLDGCVFWNYLQCISEGSGTREVYSGNLFVNCGNGSLQHSIYISNSAASASEGARILGNVFIGGEGYHIHLWHGPANTVIQGNFSAQSVGSLVVDGPGHTVSHNVLWSQQTAIELWPLNLSANAGGTYTSNLHGEDARSDRNPREWRTGALRAGLSVSSNTFVGNCATFGTSAQAITVASLPDILGYSKAEIDTAISDLETAFAQTPTQIQADATITPKWNALQSVAAAWAAL
jgi:hypothetical protein